MRLAQTVRHLQASQVCFRVWKRLAGPAIKALARMKLPPVVRRPWARRLIPAWYCPAKFSGDGRIFSAVGESGVVEVPSDWNCPARSRLWRFNLHYLDDLSIACPEQLELQRRLLARWIQEQPPARGDGWHPYPLSLRIVNMVRFLDREQYITADQIQSLARQARALSLQMEYDVLGNHLFANAKAMVFAGAFLSGSTATHQLTQSLRLLDAQLAEQFLPDGGHFERSPMYHAALLWDICDLVNLADATGLTELLSRRPQWAHAVESGLIWLNAMSLPDGDISFFNDAAFEIAPPLARIVDYWRQLGGQWADRCNAPSEVTCEWLKESGYFSVLLPDQGKLIIDAAPIEPAYQPGHAHADTLSFELAVAGQRLFVNSGTSTYQISPLRCHQRSTAAHNTVEVNSENSSDVWSSFRVGRRARPYAVEASHRKHRLHIAASHDGYAWLPRKPMVRREWVVTSRSVTVVDAVSSQPRSAIARYLVHPDVSLEENRTLRFKDGKAALWTVSHGVPRVVPAQWHPRFGQSMPTRCIEVELVNGQAALTVEW
jgi:uncharacterized heparinase superfamily protein